MSAHIQLEKQINLSIRLQGYPASCACMQCGAAHTGTSMSCRRNRTSLGQIETWASHHLIQDQALSRLRHSSISTAFATASALSIDLMNVHTHDRNRAASSCVCACAGQPAHDHSELEAILLVRQSDTHSCPALTVKEEIPSPQYESETCMRSSIHGLGYQAHQALNYNGHSHAILMQRSSVINITAMYWEDVWHFVLVDYRRE